MLFNLKQLLFHVHIKMPPTGSELSMRFRKCSRPEMAITPWIAYSSTIKALHSTYEIIATLASTKIARNGQSPELMQEELVNGSRLGFDSYDDTCCAGRHAKVESYVKGKMVTANGFANTMSSLKNIPIAKMLYAYDSPDGEVFV